MTDTLIGIAVFALLVFAVWWIVMHLLAKM